MALVTEDQVELQSIEWFQDLGYQYVCGYDIAVDGETPERTDYRSVVLKDRLLSALTRINPEIPRSAIDTALSQLMNPNIPALMSCNRQVHSWLTKGVRVTYQEGNETVGKQLKIIDFDYTEDNEWLVAYCKDELKKKHRDYFIFGHRHLPLDIELPERSRYINLGDWMNHNSYAVFDGKDISIQFFKNNEACTCS